jgi:peptide/nickel transport system permease protein
MFTFILQRTFQSLLVVILAALLVHTIMYEVVPYHIGPEQRGWGFVYDTARIDAPWPLEFLMWLFTPDGVVPPSPQAREPQSTQTGPRDPVRLIRPMARPPSIDVEIFGLRIKGSGVLTGDLGYSRHIHPGIPVTEVIASRWGNTLVLVVLAFIPTLLISIPLGVIAAARRNSWLDHVVTLVSFTGLSIPGYWLGLLLIVFFAVIAKQLHDMNGWGWLPYFPSGGVATVGQEGDWLNRLYHLVLPVMALAFGQIAFVSRYVRFSMLEVLRKDYIRTALAKGLPWSRVVFRHALRNAIVPVITTIALTLPTLVAGTIVIETVFGYAGMGQLFFQAMGGTLATDRITLPGVVDYELALILLLLMVTIVVLCNLLADVLYAIFNPRLLTTGQ